ncbi:MAG: mandelate racemase [Chloroflexi bacterium]|nr:mandelate racemase [Chloroflexota bacterium]
MSYQVRIVSVEWAELEGRRPRHAGSNARLGDHGLTVRVPFARLTADDGSAGFGFCQAGREQAEALLGRPLAELLSEESGATVAGRAFDYPLWDLIGKRRDLPVYALLAAAAGRAVVEPFAMPCYDTSLYFDDLHLADNAAAADLLAQEAREGYARGHRHFKIKVGRGARHLPLEAGTQRDIAIVRAVRQAVGADAQIMLDANNGYNLNLAKRVLAETADCRVFWLEEAFHEDAVLYADLKSWLADQRLAVLIADGEGQASPSLLTWAQDGLIDVVQYDVFGYGFTPWLALARQLDGWGVRSAPHHYGRLYGNYVAAHLAAVCQRFTFVEWDEAQTPALDTSAYRVEDGRVYVPRLPGFGLTLDEPWFRRAAAEHGFLVRADHAAWN